MAATGILGLETGTPLDFDDGSALNPNTRTTARTAMTESHTRAGRREDAGLILIHRNAPGPRRVRWVLLPALIEAMAIASSAETADESSGNRARIRSGRGSSCSGTVGHVSSIESFRLGVVGVDLE